MRRLFKFDGCENLIHRQPRLAKSLDKVIAEGLADAPANDPFGQFILVNADLSDGRELLARKGHA